ncbi:MAG: hybrid sensor histidine kinase/response regulator [bacterium]|nr:hybrid sensor histidine kinase/response regulator [bacterium]
MTIERKKKQPPLIFVAEDLPRNLQVVYNILKREGYDIAAAGNGRKALQMLQTLRPDLILLDIMMPEMDGLELCRRLKQIPELEEIPVIFLTAKVDTTDVVEGLELGAVDYITKPFKAKELATRVKNHLQYKFSREALKESNAAKDKLFSIIAHDVRDPLQNLLLSSDLLRQNIERFDKERITEYVGKFYDNTSILAAMMDNLLVWARSQQHMLEPLPGVIKVIPIVNKIIDLVKEATDKKNISIICDIPSEISVYADENMLRIVLRNLVSNAIKFISAGKITVSAKTNEDYIELSVSDSGVGIPPEALCGLFKLQSNKSTIGTAGEKGTGLGLILCRELVEKNNGTINVSSEPNKGTRFTITLPKDASVT